LAISILKAKVRAMAEAATPARRMIPATLLFALPGVGALVAAGLLGFAPWAYVAAGSGFVVFGTAALLARHFRHVFLLRNYFETLRAADLSAQPIVPPKGGDLLYPGLNEAIRDTLRDRQQRRQELIRTISNHEAVLSALPDSLLLIDAQRRILRCNPAAEALFGSDITGRDLTLVLRNPELIEATDEVLAGAQGRVVEFTVPGQFERHLSCRVANLTVTASDGTAAIIALHDLTAVRRAEQMRADFVANASHELRTPLASLLGFIETLIGPARDDADARVRFLAVMHEQAKRMSRLIEDLLSLSRIELHEYTPPSSTADIELVLRSVANALEPQARAKSMKLELDFAGVEPVSGQADELTQVFQNLTENAIKYGRDGTAVRLVTRRIEAGSGGARRLGRPGIAVSVIDQGEGIAREHLPRLTERFYRVDTARSRELGGTGLGLAIVKHIINRHRAVLDIDSTIGEGSRFRVFLPLAAGAAFKKPGNPSESAGSNRPKAVNGPSSTTAPPRDMPGSSIVESRPNASLPFREHS